MRNSWRIFSAIMVGVATVFAVAESSAAETARPARLEPIPGSELKRVILTGKAAERLAIATAAVREQRVIRWRVLEGTVEAAGAEPSTSSAPTVSDAARRVRIRVENFHPGKYQAELHSALLAWPKAGKDDDDDGPKGGLRSPENDRNESFPIVVVPAGDDHVAAGLPIKPIRVAAVRDTATKPGGAGAAIRYYEVMTPSHGLQPGQQVYVKVPDPGTDALRPVIPYSAVIYDPSGGTWVYTNPEPLVFVRHRIEVDFIQAGLAVLKDGPTEGTAVVATGAVLLMGVELKFGQ
jgi:hypothetical protein